MFSVSMSSVDTDDLFDEEHILPRLQREIKYIRIILHRSSSVSTSTGSSSTSLSDSFDNFSLWSMSDTVSCDSSGFDIVQKHLEEYNLSTYKVSFILTDKTFTKKLEYANKGQLKINVEGDTAILTYNENARERLDSQGVEKQIIDSLRSIHDEIQEITVAFENSNFHLVVSHLDYYMQKVDTVNMYTADAPFTICFVFSDRENQGLLDHHIEIVRSQKVLNKDMYLSTYDKIIVAANMEDILLSPAIVTCLEDRVTISGFEEDANGACVFIRRLFQKRHVKLHCLNTYERALMQNETFVNKTLKRGHFDNIWWRVEKATLEMEGSCGNHVGKALRLILNSFRSIAFELKDGFQSEKWIDIKDELVNTYTVNIFIDESLPKVNIAMTEDIFNTVDITIKEFIDRHTIVTKSVFASPEKCVFLLDNLKEDVERELTGELVTLHSGPNNECIEVVGTEKAFTDIRESLLRVSTKRFSVATKCVHNLKERDFEDISRKFRLRVTENTTKINIKRGRIETEQVDVIVNSVARNLNLLMGKKESLSDSIYHAAGHMVQTNLRKYKNALNHVGMILSTKSGGLKSHEIYHVVLDLFLKKKADTCIQSLASAVTKCLHRAASSDYTSISFPAIATGALAYPPPLAAEAIIGAIVHFVNTTVNSTLQQINIVILEQSSENWNAFNTCIDRRKQELKILEDLKATHFMKSPPFVPSCYCHVTATTGDDVDIVAEDIDKDLKHQTFPMRLAETLETLL